MRLVLSPAFEAGAWPGPLADGREAVAGEAWVGIGGFVARLETTLGLSGIQATELERVIALGHTLRATDGPWRRSFEADELGTAARLLGDRDALAMEGWSGESVSDRLAELARVTREVSAGVADRLVAIAQALTERSPEVEAVECGVPRDELSNLVKRVLGALVARGVRVTERRTTVADASGDLAAARAATFTPTGDGSLQLVRAHGAMRAADDVAAWLAAQDSLTGTVIIGANAVLDEALAAHGLPTTGAGRGAPAAMALLPLVLDAGWQPADPAKLHALLTLPGPVPAPVARRLRRSLDRLPARGSPAWETALAEGIEALDEPERAGATTTVAALLGPVATREAGYPREDIIARAEVVSEWAQARCARGESRAWSPVREQCAALAAMARAAPAQPVGEATLRSWCDRASLAASSAPTRPAQAGLAIVEEPGAIAGPARRIIWWGFERAQAQPPPRLRVTARERAALAARGIVLPGDGRRAIALAAAWRRPLAAARETLLLVCPQVDEGGELAHPHPLWDELAAAAGTEVARLVHAVPRSPRAVPRVQPAPLALPAPQVSWQAPAPMGTRTPESPSSVEALISCSLAYALRYHGALRPGAATPPPAPTPMLFGDVAHEILRRVLAMPRESGPEAAEAAGACFDQEGPHLAATLFLPQHRTRRAMVRHHVTEAARALVDTLVRAGASVRATEAEVERDDAGLHLRGRLDVRVSSPDVILDLKWGSGARYVEALRGGTALQLAAYAHAARADGSTPRVGYFVVQRRELHVEAGSALPHAIEHRPRNEDVWQRARTTLAARQAQLAAARLLAPPAGGAEIRDAAEPELTLAPRCDYCAYRRLCGQGLPA